MVPKLEDTFLESIFNVLDGFLITWQLKRVQKSLQGFTVSPQTRVHHWGQLRPAVDAIYLPLAIVVVPMIIKEFLSLCYKEVCKGIEIFLCSIHLRAVLQLCAVATRSRTDAVELKASLTPKLRCGWILGVASLPLLPRQHCVRC